MVMLSLIQLYSFIVLLWCVLSWFPKISWYNQPFRTIDMLVRPACEPLRRILPPIANLDLSPLILMFILQGLAGLVRGF
jgi:YggT family protein